MTSSTQKSRVSAQNRIDFRTKEGFDKISWMEAADHHLRSAEILRRVKKRRRAITRKTAGKAKLVHIQAMDAAVHSSTLLVGYAVELFLKAGLTRLYVGCSKELFQRDVKGRYGHDLIKLAKSVEYPGLTGNRERLKRLGKIILSEGRYPFLTMNDPSADIKRRTDRALRFWNDDEFKCLVALAYSIREHVQLINQDEDNPSSHQSVVIDDDGYFAFRCGGNLSSRITVRYSSVQRANKKNNKRGLKSLILRNLSNPLIRQCWDSAQYRCVKV